MIIAILLLVWLGMNANTATINCDWTALELNKNLSLAKKIEKNLITGFWLQNNKEQQTLIQFYQSGRVDWITSSKESGTTYLYGQWKLDFYSEKPVLNFKGATIDLNQYFELERTCEGVLLINRCTQSEIALEHQLKLNAIAMKAAKVNLSGSWNNATYPFDISKDKKSVGTRKAMKGAYLKISFKKDGSFVKKYGSTKIKITKIGRWEIAKNGKFIFLHYDNKTEIAKIQHLDIDEMVLEFQLNNPENHAFATTQKLFAFIR